ncbi:protein REVEILLE 3-like isoform X2 [Zingiber officinale]|uniref:protein REVEILLE 3-like isoform X2 n=1 Tax=Zingiber officinale TaxID=94328 RepID=UPI001C4B1830|nr:protein REVEILLE 3-like isoform X2 [Zingiber officinale]XP_042373592.1 protein REVEILLE 3-like isoform X2 [Zingiber officinale]
MVSAQPGAPDGGGGSGNRRGATEDAPLVSRLLPHRPPPLKSLPRASTDDPSKKIRKPYTITKSRESWTEQEHDKFLEALHLFDRDWKKIEAFVGSKTAIQIRSHAQKYFLKVQKNGTSEHVPPPRPKRKAAHPYPHKGPKNGTASVQLSCLLEPGDALAVDISSTPGNSTSKAQMHSKGHSCLQPVTASHQTAADTRPAGVSTTNNCSTSTICLTTWPTSETADREKLTMDPRDFAKVYSFLGSVFEPGSTGHLEKLKEMDPIDVETVCYLPQPEPFTNVARLAECLMLSFSSKVLLLMRNLALNLISPDYESHIRLLSSSADVKFAITNNIFSAC